MKERAETSGREEGDFVDHRLYVADRTPRCLTAYENTKKICEAYSPGKYRITVIDLREHPQVDHGYAVFSWGVRFADILCVLVRGETPGCPVSDIEPVIDKIPLFSP